MRTFFSLFFLILYLSLNLFAQEDPFVLAKSFYLKGAYDKAIEEYKKIENKNNFSIYFNLGNSYYKKGDFPLALLYFKKAAKLNPHNSDLLFNIKLTKIQLNLANPTKSIFKTIISFSSYFHINELLFIIVLLLFIISIIRNLKSDKVLFKFAFFVCIILLLADIFFLGVKYVSGSKTEGIVLGSKDNKIYSSPSSEAFVVIAELQAGEEIYIEEDDNGYSRIIKKSDENIKGWIKKTSFEKI